MAELESAEMDVLTGAPALAGHAGLFPPAAARIGIEDWLTQELADAGRRIAAGPVVPRHDAAGFGDALAGFDFARPRELGGVLAWTIAQLEGGLVQITHPRYFGLFNPAPSFPAQCADRIAAAFNPQLATWTTSPAAVEIEAHVIRAIAARAGLPAGSGGHFTTGGAEANFTALQCALAACCPAYAEHGARGAAGAPVFYISAEAHHAWIKIAHQAGLGRAAVRLVGTDGAGRMDPAALAAAVAADRAQGALPVMAVATAGTTAAGMLDPVAAIAAVARQAGLWLHVDAAWGGALIVSDRHRALLAELAEADSLTIDAHKWLATTMGCGMFLTRRPALLAEAFRVATGYMPSNNAARDPYVTSVQWSRRFLGLRLFLALAVAGWDGYAAHVEHALALADLLRRRLEACGWRVVNASPLAVLCATPPAGAPDAATIVRRVLASGAAWISTALFEGQAVVRICVTHGTTTADDAACLVAAMERARAAP
jgi:aromatic-L-amino-acid decarboxylase